MDECFFDPVPLLFSDVTELERITFDPNVMGGRACIRDTRVTVSLVVKLVANGMTPDEIVEDYPGLLKKGLPIRRFPVVRSASV